jgi:hypothetical protein
MSKDFGITSVFGQFLMLLALVLFICYILIGDTDSVFFAIAFGITGAVLSYLSKKIDGERLIIVVMLFVIAGVVPLLIDIKNVTEMVVIICGFSGIYFVLKSPDAKK